MAGCWLFQAYSYYERAIRILGKFHTYWLFFVTLSAKGVIQFKFIPSSFALEIFLWKHCTVMCSMVTMGVIINFFRIFQKFQFRVVCQPLWFQSLHQLFSTSEGIYFWYGLERFFQYLALDNYVPWGVPKNWWNSHSKCLK